MYQHIYYLTFVKVQAQQLSQLLKASACVLVYTNLGDNARARIDSYEARFKPLMQAKVPSRRWAYSKMTLLNELSIDALSLYFAALIASALISLKAIHGDT